MRYSFILLVFPALFAACQRDDARLKDAEARAAELQRRLDEMQPKLGRCEAETAKRNAADAEEKRQSEVPDPPPCVAPAGRVMRETERVISCLRERGFAKGQPEASKYKGCDLAIYRNGRAFGVSLLSRGGVVCAAGYVTVEAKAIDHETLEALSQCAFASPPGATAAATVPRAGQTAVVRKGDDVGLSFNRALAAEMLK